MRLIFLYGPPAAGKLTIGRILAERTGMKLFHNHLIVDAVGAVFPFGSAEFVRLRELFWMETIAAAIRSGQSLIFTFAPEPSVSEDFPRRVSDIVSDLGGETVYVALSVDDAEQEARIDHPARAGFGKLRSLELLRAVRPSMRSCMAMMPEPRLVIETGSVTPDQAADAILRLLDV